MPRGGSRVGAGRPKNGVKRAKKPTVSVPTNGGDEVVGDVVVKTPLEYMLAVMNDPGADERARNQMAVAAAPYCHPKIGEGGKKAARDGAAKRVGAAGIFAPAAPPKLVVNNK